MAAKWTKVALFVCVLALFPGCVEMTQTFTLNPDGRGKVKLEILSPAYDFDLNFGNDGQKKKEKSPDQLRKDAISKFISNAPVITAWKDVSVSWSRDGRLHMVGTAYFERLEDLDKRDEGPKDPSKVSPTSTFQSALRLERQKDGTLRLTAKNQGITEGMQKAGENKDAVDIAKMTDK